MTRKNPMQVSIERILKAHGLERLDQQGFHARFEMAGYDPLVIERLPDGQVSVAHYFEQNGDLMADPEIVFDLATWEPLEITQSPVGVYRRKFVQRDGNTYVDVNFRRDVMPLVRVWARNLRWQGWERATLTE